MHVVRTEPRDRTLNYEPNNFAGIEFDPPDFPWLFTPAAPSGDRLRPWVALLALADGSEWKPVAARGPLPGIEVARPARCPTSTSSWAWAHVQVTGGIGPTTVESLQVDEPGRVLSRLICPRRLRPLTAYTAFLVPAFDTGRRGSVGAPACRRPGLDAGTPACGCRSTTGSASRRARWGDFESLVRALAPRVLPKEVGIRDMDVDPPGWGPPSAGAPLGLAGALRSVQTTDTVWSGSDRDAFQAALTEHVNRGALPVDTGPGSPDPVVEPPLYGRWHAARSSVDPHAPGWLDELNTDPRPRAMAGLTRVVLDQRRADALGLDAGRRSAEGEPADPAGSARARRRLACASTKHFLPADPGTLCWEMTLAAARLACWRARKRSRLRLPERRCRAARSHRRSAACRILEVRSRPGHGVDPRRADHRPSRERRVDARAAVQAAEGDGRARAERVGCAKQLGSRGGSPDCGHGRR